MISDERLAQLADVKMICICKDDEYQEMARELLALRKEKLMLGIYHESKPRFYPRFNVVYMDDNKVCGYTLHTGRFSAFERKNFDKNFIKAGLPE